MVVLQTHRGSWVGGRFEGSGRFEDPSWGPVWSAFFMHELTKHHCRLPRRSGSHRTMPRSCHCSRAGPYFCSPACFPHRTLTFWACNIWISNIKLKQVTIRKVEQRDLKVLFLLKKNVLVHYCHNNVAWQSKSAFRGLKQQSFSLLSTTTWIARPDFRPQV